MLHWKNWLASICTRQPDSDKPGVRHKHSLYKVTEMLSVENTTNPRTRFYSQPARILNP